MMIAFSDVFADVTKQGTKLQTSEYLASGKYPIIDQGQDDIAGYTDREDGLFTDVPAIIFGDHTRIVKYVDMPFFLGADGVKVLKATIPDVDYRYLYYAVSAVKIPNTGYNRHFKWLKEAQISLPDLSTQRRIADTLDKVSEGIGLCGRMMDELDLMVKAKFGEMFGDPLTNDRKWLSFPLTKACKAILGGGTPSKSHPEYFIGMIPWVSPKDMKSAVISDSIDHITEEAIVHSTTKLVPKNSVLMVIRSGILKHTLPVAVNSVPVTINQDMKAFVPSNMITTEFLMYYFKAIESDVLAGVRGVTADNIDFKAFQQRTIVAPPLELQNRFAAFVAEVDKLKLTIQGIRDKMEMKKLALMQGFFG